MTEAVLSPLLAADRHRPRLTWYSADGARTELSTASLANWSAKVAGLLRDELGLVPGDRVSVLLPAGWQTLPVLLGAWWAGAEVCTGDEPDAVAAFVPDASDPQLGAADEVFVVSGHPLGAPSLHVAPHQRDFTSAVLPQADRFAGVPAGPAAPALYEAGLSVAQVLAAAEAAADAPRLLLATEWTLPEVLPSLLGPLLAGGSVVAVDPAAAPGDIGRWAEAERVTVR